MLGHRAVCFALLVPVVAGCGDLCGNSITQTVVSPTGKRAAVEFTRDCGATTGFSTQVSILSGSGRLPNSGGNVLALGELHSLHLKWLSDEKLIISGVGGMRTFVKNLNIEGVTLEYSN